MNTFTIILSRSDAKPLYEQLYLFIALEIKEGRLCEDEKLPSKKALASHLGISQNTVETAYSMLSQEGYIRAKPKSGFYVCRLDGFLPPADTALQKCEETKQPGYDFDFGTNAVDISSFPYSTWAKLERETLYSGSNLLSYGDPRGDLELRESIVKYLHEFRAVMCTSDQLVIGAGIEYLLMLLERLFEDETIFAVEDPGYKKTARILQNGGKTVTYIPLDENGMQPSHLIDSGASVSYITPSCQFPTGVIMPIGRRVELLRWAYEKMNRYIVEDDYNSEFNFIGRPIPSIQGIDTLGRVIYMSTFSRILAPSIRIAYMVLPPPLMDRFKEKFFSYSSTVSRFEQHTLARFISGGYLNRHLSRVKTIYKKRKDALIACIKSIPECSGISISGDSAGLQLLLTMDQGLAEQVKKRAEQYKIRLTDVSDYRFTTDKRKTEIMLGYASMDAERLYAGVMLLFKGDHP